MICACIHTNHLSTAELRQLHLRLCGRSTTVEFTLRWVSAAFSLPMATRVVWLMQLERTQLDSISRQNLGLLPNTHSSSSRGMKKGRESEKWCTVPHPAPSRLIPSLNPHGLERGFFCENRFYLLFVGCTHMHARALFLGLRESSAETARLSDGRWR